MNETLELLARHGGGVVFAAVFIEQIGVPLPAAPWLALLLHRNGVLRVRPLLGGIDAWRERNYPTELREAGMINANE